MDLVEQLRYFALDLEKESETRPPSGEHKSSSLCVESFVLDHGPTKWRHSDSEGPQKKQFGKLGTVKDRTKCSQS